MLRIEIISSIIRSLSRKCVNIEVTESWRYDGSIWEARKTAQLLLNAQRESDCQQTRKNDLRSGRNERQIDHQSKEWLARL